MSNGINFDCARGNELDMLNALRLIICISLPLLIAGIKGRTVNDKFKLTDLSKILTILLIFDSISFFCHKFIGAKINNYYFYFYTLIRIVLTLALVAAVLRYSPLKKISIKSLLNFPKFERTSTFYVVILSFIIINSFGAFLIVELFPNMVGQQINTVIFLKAIDESPFILTPVLVLIEVFAIVGEELVYRYFAINALRQKLKKISTIIISSLIWSFMHWHASFGVLIAGILIGYFYYETESLSLCVMLHFLFNFSVLSASLYLFYKDIGSLAIPAYQYALALFACQIFLYHLTEIFIVKTNLQKQIKY